MSWIVVLGGGVFAVYATNHVRSAAAASSTGSQLLQNGSFASGLAPWSLAAYTPAHASVSIQYNKDLARNTAAVTVTRADPSHGWHVQFYQDHRLLSAGATVTISFRARASHNRPAEVVVQSNISPWPVYFSHSLPLTTGWQSYAFTYTQPANITNAFLGFNLAQSTGTVYLDSIGLSTPQPTATQQPQPTATQQPQPTATQQPQPTATQQPQPTATPSSPVQSPGAPAGGATAAGSVLPSDATCAQQVPASSWEPRPGNATYNRTVPTAAQLAGLQPWNGNTGYAASADALRQRVTGNYTGTTDQILQWAACKWGIDPNVVRAEADYESGWKETAAGDFTTTTSLCPPSPTTGNGGCYQSYGMLQTKYHYHPDTYPMIRTSTAFSTDWSYGYIRACYEGDVTWLAQETPTQGYPSYRAGDLWGCIGWWYSGNWYDSGALQYIAAIKHVYTQKPWLQSGF